MDQEDETDVHTRHCCLRHGCKYRDGDCTVVTKLKKQEYPCESCDWEASEEGPVTADKLISRLILETGHYVAYEEDEIRAAFASLEKNRG